jgi:ribosomal protein S18 acetylase RimI-like enzyme
VTVVSLFVQPENQPAYGLYKKLGFTPGRYEYAYWRRCAQQGAPVDAGKPRH